MKHYALLCGSAPDGLRQKKLVQMQEFLTTTAEQPRLERSVVCLPNGADESLLGYAIENIFSGRAGNSASGLLLYFCTQSPVLESESSLWLCQNEISRGFINGCASRAKALGIDMQVIFDTDRDFVTEESLGYEMVGLR